MLVSYTTAPPSKVPMVPRPMSTLNVRLERRKRGEFTSRLLRHSPTQSPFVSSTTTQLVLPSTEIEPARDQILTWAR